MCSGYGFFTSRSERWETRAWVNLRMVQVRAVLFAMFRLGRYPVDGKIGRALCKLSGVDVNVVLDIVG